jgi:hypothetical protein
VEEDSSNREYFDEVKVKKVMFQGRTVSGKRN